MSYLQENSKPVTLFELGKMRAEGRKIVMLTGYDASFAALLERCGVDVILVGAGLANGLIAWRLKTTRPDLRVMTVATAPSGLTLVTGLDPTSAVLRQRQQLLQQRKL